MIHVALDKIRGKLVNWSKFIACGVGCREYFAHVMSTKSKKKAATGVRYSDAQKKEVVDFVIDYNNANGRGGQSVASKKFKVTPLTISAWIKSFGQEDCRQAREEDAKAAKAPKAAKRNARRASKKGVTLHSRTKTGSRGFRELLQCRQWPWWSKSGRQEVQAFRPHRFLLAQERGQARVARSPRRRSRL